VVKAQTPALVAIGGILVAPLLGGEKSLLFAFGLLAEELVEAASDLQVAAITAQTFRGRRDPASEIHFVAPYGSG
jgi:hypothetical protein